MATDRVLREDDLFDIQEKLWDARSKWKNIGLGLKIRPPDLQVIDRNHHDDDDKFQGVILKWLQIGGKDRTWAALCKVLSARSVGHGQLAEQIRRARVDVAASSASLDSHASHYLSKIECSATSDTRQSASLLGERAIPQTPSETNPLAQCGILPESMDASPMKPVTASYKEAESSPYVFDTPQEAPNTLNDSKEERNQFDWHKSPRKFSKETKNRSTFYHFHPYNFPCATKCSFLSPQ